MAASSSKPSAVRESPPGVTPVPSLAGSAVSSVVPEPKPGGMASEAPAGASSPPSEIESELLTLAADEIEALSLKWPEWLHQQEMALPLVGKYLKNSAITEVSGSRVHLALDPRFNEYLPKLEEDGSRKKIEKSIGKLLEGTVNIELTVWDTPPVGVATDHEDEKPKELVEEGPLVSSAQTEAPKTFHEWSKDPVVKKTLEIFNADILEVNEPS